MSVSGTVCERVDGVTVTLCCVTVWEPTGGRARPLVVGWGVSTCNRKPAGKPKLSLPAAVCVLLRRVRIQGAQVILSVTAVPQPHSAVH